MQSQALLLTFGVFIPHILKRGKDCTFMATASSSSCLGKGPRLLCAFAFFGDGWSSRHLGSVSLQTFPCGLYSCHCIETSLVKFTNNLDLFKVDNTCFLHLSWQFSGTRPSWLLFPWNLFCLWCLEGFLLLLWPLLLGLPCWFLLSGWHLKCWKCPAASSWDIISSLSGLVLCIVSSSSIALKFCVLMFPVLTTTLNSDAGVQPPPWNPCLGQ